MSEFYHITRKEYLTDILGEGDRPGEGLKPRGDTGKEGWENSLGNPEYIYLSKKPLSLEELYQNAEKAGAKLPRDNIERTTLRVALSDDQEIERDYEQVLSIARMSDENLEKLGGGTDRKAIISSIFEMFGLTFEGDLSEDNLKAQLDKIPAEDYDGILGSYRTKRPIPVEQISIYESPPVKREFHHITRKEYLPTILGEGDEPGEGLKPRSETGKQGWENNGADPNWIYLTTAPSLEKLYEMAEQVGTRFPRDNVERDTLTVALPEDQVERDYEQVLNMLRMSDENLEKLGGGTDRRAILSEVFKNAGLTFEGDLTEENIKAQLDKIPTEKYDWMCGNYKTMKPVPVGDISV